MQTSQRIRKKNENPGNTATVSAAPDSTAGPAVVQTTPPTPPKKGDRAKSWTLSVYAGPQFDITKNQNTAYATLETKPAFRYSAELNRTIISGFGAATGFGYYKTNETYARSTYQVDSVFIGIDTIPILDQNDSVIGYEYVENYGTDSTKNTSQFNYISSNLVIPVYIAKTIELNDQWGILVNAGVVYRMSKVTGGPVSPYGPEPVVTRNSLMISGRIHATCKWNSWMFSLGLNAGYYVKPPVQYEGINKNRSFFTPEIGVHFSF